VLPAIGQGWWSARSLSCLHLLVLSLQVLSWACFLGQHTVCMHYTHTHVSYSIFTACWEVSREAGRCRERLACLCCATVTITWTAMALTRRTITDSSSSLLAGTYGSGQRIPACVTSQISSKGAATFYKLCSASHTCLVLHLLHIEGLLLHIEGFSPVLRGREWTSIIRPQGLMGSDRQQQ
jgi:hypothetical protein